MKLTAFAIVVMLVAAVPASGQTSEPEAEPAPAEHPYGLDPYNPSDAALLREYGVTLVAQTPLAELRKLDPYKPSHAALLRQLGGGIPLWGWAWYAPGPAPLTPFSPVALTPSPAAPTGDLFERRSRARDVESSPPPDAVGPPLSTSIATLRKPVSNDGVWILYQQQTWISAGPPVPYDEADFQRVGEYGTFPVFKRTGASGEVIYVPTRRGLMAPYRLKP
jgi:hypothetical protein